MRPEPDEAHGVADTGSAQSDGPTAVSQQRQWALAFCHRVMLPVVRLALAYGLKHLDLVRLLRHLFIQEAGDAWRRHGLDPTVSRISVSTGLNRKAVAASLPVIQDALPRSDSSAAARTVTLWMEMAEKTPQHLRLPVAATAGTVSFEQVAQRASRGNVHHRTILEELVRLGMAVEQDGALELKAQGFVPVDDLQLMLAFLSDDAQDHLLAGMADVVSRQDALLEDSYAVAGLRPAQAAALQESARRRWHSLQDELGQQMRHAVESVEGRGTARLRVGFYAYQEVEEAGCPAAPSPEGTP